MAGPAADACAAYVDTWRIFAAWWGSRWEEHSRLTSKLGARFQSIDIAANLVLNVVALNALHLVLISAAGFSAEFKRLSVLFVVLPCLLGSFVYVHFKYGDRMWLAVPGAARGWLQNFLLVNAIALVCWTQQALLYTALLGLEPWLPSTLQGPLTFPVRVVELAFTHCTMATYVVTFLILLSLPIWTYAYKLNMNLVGRKAHMSSLEAFLEVVYFGSASMSVYQVLIPLTVLHAQLGFPFHIVHVLFGVVEVVLVNRFTQYKFAVLHKLSHDIPALYHMVHLEHHICKGIYPNTSAAGLWEFWLMGGSATFCTLPIVSLPYLHFTMVHFGANILVHTMWPMKSWAQWHTLHHIMLSDVYNVNIPSDHDRLFSKDVSKYDVLLKKNSFFVQIPWLSDAVAGIFLCVAMACFHYGLGWSIFAVWHQAQW